jgi:serine/threonine protein phosphatase PrpC
VPVPDDAAFPPGYVQALDSLLSRSYLLSPDQLPAVVAECAVGLGAAATTIYLVDYDQSVLVPVHGAEGDHRDPLRIDATLAGNAFRRMASQLSGSGDDRRVWVPLIDGVERLGVIEYVLAPGAVPELHLLEQFSHLVAELVVGKGAYTDTFEWTRRLEPMALAAEMQWNLLPPLTFGTSRLVISGLLAPAYEVGGDAFDYAVNGSLAHVAVFDSMGHGLGASALASLAVGAYRNARRAGLGLQDTALTIDEALRDQHGGERFVTAVLGRLDLDTGVFTWLSAGHPAPLLLRNHKVLRSLEHEPCQPLGLLDLAGGAPPEMQEESLQPGDRLLLFTDGVDEARGRDGSFFGMARLAEFVAKQSASGEPTPEVMRRLQRAVLDHQQGRLQDDATTLFVEWLTGKERPLEL